MLIVRSKVLTDATVKNGSVTFKSTNSESITTVRTVVSENADALKNLINEPVPNSYELGYFQDSDGSFISFR